MNLKTDRLEWLGHAGFRLSGSRVVYFDPWEAVGPRADLILITHDHYDHCDAPTVRALSGPDTLVVTTAAAAAKLEAGGLKPKTVILKPGDETEALGVHIKAVPAYNIDKDFHPKAAGHLGFVVTLDGLTVYHAGDTDRLEEMKSLKAQAALLPVSGTYVMTAEEAAAAALDLNPEVAIPMHYGRIVGDESMARAFAEALNGRLKVEIKVLAK